MVGAYFKGHPLPLGARVKVETRDELATGSLPKSFSIWEEIYDFRTNPRTDPNTKILLSIDDKISPCDILGGAVEGPGCEITRTAGDWTMGPDHPIAWQKPFEGGRSFYTNLGHNPATWQRPEFVSHLMGGIRWALGEDRHDGASVAAEGLNEALRVDVAPNGDVYLIERGGDLSVVPAATGVRRRIGHLEVNTLTEQGLLGMVLDPGFATNHQLYLYFVEGAESPVGKVARFTLDAGGNLDLSSRVDLLAVPQDGSGHAGGALEIDADGSLLLATGDNTTPFLSSGYSPIDTRPGHELENAMRSAGNPNDLRGKVLRIRRDGSIPSGNLFPAGVGGRPEILAMGFRNPFSIAVGATSSERYIGDVGPDSVFDGGPGPRGYDEIARIAAPGDFGWPKCLGDQHPYRVRDFNTDALGAPFDCSATVPPALSYDYLNVTQWALADGGRTAIAGHVMLPADTTGPFSQPARFDGSLIMADFSRSRLAAVTIGADGRASRVERLFPQLHIDRPIDVDVAPDGAMYVLEYGFGGAGKLLRIEHSATGRQRPTISIAADRTSGAAPLTVQLSAEATTIDATDSIDRIEWDFDGDGVVDATGPTATATFAASGEHRVSAIARSDNGLISLRRSVTVSVGNTPPEVTITQDPPGPVTTGEVVTYRATVTDAEDTGDVCARVHWQVSIGHNTHEHPEADSTGGCELVSNVTLDENHAPGATLYWVVRAGYTDTGVDGSGADSLSATATAKSQLAVANTDWKSQLPKEVRKFLEIVAAGPTLEDVLRSLDWYRAANDGIAAYIGGF